MWVEVLKLIIALIFTMVLGPFSNNEQLIKSSLSSKSVIDKNLGSSKRVVEGILND